MTIPRFFPLLLPILMLAGTGTAAAKDIVVGASAALTGKYAGPAQQQVLGFHLWLEEVNTRGGLLGRKVRLVHYDDESKPQASARLYEHLITADKVDLLLGPYSSPVTAAAATVAEKYDFPMVSAGAAGSEIWRRGHKNVFGLYAPATAYMEQILGFSRSKGLKRVALIYEGAAAANDVADGVRAKSKVLGMHVVFDEDYGKAPTDFASVIGKIKTRKPDVVIIASYLPEAATFMRQARESRLYAKMFVFAVGPGLPDFGSKLGLDAEGVLGNSQWEPDLGLPGSREFVGRFKARYGLEPGYHAAGGYGAGQVLEAAVKKAGTLDRPKLRRALAELDVITTFGRYKVDGSGRQIGKSAYTVQWLSGEREVVLPQEFATRKIAYPFRDWAKR